MIEALEKQAVQEIEKSPNTKALRELEVRLLGKNGEITGLMRQLANLSPEEKPKFGKAVNELKERVQSMIEARNLQLHGNERQAQFEQEKIDITMPSRRPSIGLEHLLQQTANKIKSFFVGLGFEYAEGPELEHFRYNFDALNYPPDHPAMDEQDTFYITDELLLKTQCTALQGRIFEKRKPPLRIFTIGRTFRNEAVDRTHSHTFHQIDAFMVDEGVSMAHLKGTLRMFAQAMFGEEVKVRFRPDFFPFVEPGVDYAISSPRFGGGRWLELGGAGLIHPNILKNYGIDTERYSGWAFGLGVERIPMLNYGVDDLRHFLENDLRFLSQFKL